ncbi:TM2 domain-containing membrane protein YozV [Trueperella bonasi]|uniref:TM2 domain-containing membrane protein YozV n=1 Tax=Trueperella bonasi TaxID=312286 RepID=A0ABT9NH77_9ACTO|nr:TM2 domain-containing protein [Trueperella bonasi]MDP9806550.1 TM2 domain-containing membrane protein YozV [Trueperella bonasi]
MKDETPRLSADEVRFETSPDPLLVESENNFGPNLYAPGPLGLFRGASYHQCNAKTLHNQHYARQRQAALRAHPSQLGRTSSKPRTAHPEISKPANRGKRMIAICLGLLFGTLGAHNFFLGKTQRAIVNIVVWLIGLASSSATGNLLLMLPIVALVLVECTQIWRGTGDYA